MNSGTCLVCVIDGLRADVVDIFLETFGIPVLATGSIVPPFSFKPDAAFLTGLYPEQTDSGTQFWYEPDASPFRSIKWIKRASILPYFLQLGLRRFLRLAVGRAYHCPITTARIPFAFLQYFNQVWDRYPFEEGFGTSPTVFDLLRRQNRKWIYLGAPVSSAASQHVWRVFQQASLKDISLVFLLIGDLDGVGHRHGPDSVEYLNNVERMGTFVRRVYNRMEEESGSVRGLIFGDHGMARVRQTVDVCERLSGLTVVAPKDYLYLLDSTLARFWFFSEKARTEVLYALRDLEGGRWIDPTDRDSYRIRYGHNRFGEEIWWADGGTLIFPNFWQDKKPVKGMHGYRREVAGNHAGLIQFGGRPLNWKGKDYVMEMVDVFSILTHLLRLETNLDSETEIAQVFQSKFVVVENKA